MTQFKYVGEDTRYFPTLGIEVTPEEVFKAPDDFQAHQCEKVSDQEPSTSQLTGAENDNASTN